MQDLELKRENETEEAYARRNAQREDLNYARKLDRKGQKEALDELVPRAEAGTRERQLEKKREVNEKMKSFRERSPGAAEVPESELMGGGDSLGEFKAKFTWSYRSIDFNSFRATPKERELKSRSRTFTPS